MTMTAENSMEVHECWACHKSIIGDDGMFGLCTDCLNSYGSPAAAVAALGAGLLMRAAIKHGPEAAKALINAIRSIR